MVSTGRWRDRRHDDRVRCTTSLGTKRLHATRYCRLGLSAWLRLGTEFDPTPAAASNRRGSPTESTTDRPAGGSAATAVRMMPRSGLGLRSTQLPESTTTSTTNRHN